MTEIFTNIIFILLIIVLIIILYEIRIYISIGQDESPKVTQIYRIIGYIIMVIATILIYFFM
jgi:hypothetical protein